MVWCMISDGNRMVLNIVTSRLFAFLIFQHLLSFSKFLPAPGARKPPIGFDDRLLKNLYWPWTSYHITNFVDFLEDLQFLKFSKIIAFFRFFQPQEPRNLL